MKQSFFLLEVRFLLTLLIVVSLYFMPLYPVFAQNPTALQITQQVQVATTSSAPRIDLQQGLATKTAALKARLQQFGDQNKAAKVQKINDTLAQINQNRTAQMLKNLQTMSDILAKLETKLTGISGNQDLSSAQNSITIAKTAIQTAQTQVASQSAKDYTISVSSEAGVLADATSSRIKLYNDLKTTHGLVVQAKKAVVGAIQATIQAVVGGSNATKQ